MSAAEQQSRARQRKEARRYAFACNACKVRKVKCSGEQPVCNACRRSGTTCTWQKVSTEIQLEHAAGRIQQLEQTLAEANARESRLGTSDTSPRSLEVQPSPTVPASSSLWFQVGRGDDGTVIYNGPTSRFHVEPLDDNPGETRDQDSPDQPPDSIREAQRAAYVDALTSQYGLLNTVYSTALSGNFDYERLHVEKDICITLLEIYWTWLQPLHNCVYRPSFLMDMAFGGRHYSDFLLLCILSLSARHLADYDKTFNGVDKGEQFLAQAKTLLLQELAATKPRIPTIQGLLIIGGRQCATGKSSEGWLYTGMAIRMLVDVGLHLHIDDHKLIQLERLTPVEVETRKRLYNSAYIWDKTISLALGRPPSLTRSPYPPEDILDHHDDLHMWQPVFTPEIEGNYIPVPSYNTMTFSAHSQLHKITTEKMMLFSQVPGRLYYTTEIKALEAQFISWYENLPEGLKISEPLSLAQSPPPHIVSLNVLYHALIILLYRPSLDANNSPTASSAPEICTSHSKSILDIVSLYERTFPYRLMTYQLSYCVFTAATVEVWVIKNAEGIAANGASERLSTAMRVLYHETKHTPGLSGSLETIRRQLATSKPITQPSDPSSHGREPAQTPCSHVRQVDHLHQTHGPRQSHGTDTENPDDSTATMAPPNHTTQQRISTVPYLYPHLGATTEPAFGVGGIDTGAGFHPDAFSWGFAELAHADTLEPDWNRSWLESNN